MERHLSGPITVLINPGGGAAKKKDALPQLFHLLETHLPHADVQVVNHGDEVTGRARAARDAGAKIIAAAGGDGTINAVAQAVVNTDTRLGVLPFGTRNHFASDAGIPLDMEQAVHLLTTNQVRRIDTGKVNDQIFINNASVGLYPKLVELSDQTTWTPNKTLRQITAALRLMFSASPVTVELECSAGHMHEPVWLLFFGNNSYDLNIFSGGHRQTLTTGMLQTVIVPADRRLLVPRLVARRFLGRVDPRHIRQVMERSVTVRMEDGEVAYDGQVGTMASPCIIKSVPASLLVVAPPDPQA